MAKLAVGKAKKTQKTSPNSKEGKVKKLKKLENVKDKFDTSVCKSVLSDKLDFTNLGKQARKRKQDDTETPILVRSKQHSKNDIDEDSNDEVSTGSLLRPVPPSKTYLNQSTVGSGVKALLQLINKKKNSGKELIDDEKPIFLNISIVKVPDKCKRILHIPLKHTLVKPDSEICLITPDIDSSNYKKYDVTVEHYENLLRNNDVTNINKIIPYHELKWDYGEYEMQRRLVELYDFFLMDGRIAGYVGMNFKKIFINKRKYPKPVKLSLKQNLKEHIEYTLRTVPLNMIKKGDNFTAQIGHTDMEQREIVENIFAFFDDLNKKLPGGVENIRNMYITSPKCASIPIYVTMKKKSCVNNPTSQKETSKDPIVRGELSTRLDSEVVVLRSGKVFLLSKDKQEMDENDLSDDDYIEDEDDIARKTVEESNQEPDAEEENDESDDGDLLEKEEAKYLADLDEAEEIVPDRNEAVPNKGDSKKLKSRIGNKSKSTKKDTNKMKTAVKKVKGSKKPEKIAQKKRKLKE